MCQTNAKYRALLDGEAAKVRPVKEAELPAAIIEEAPWEQPILLRGWFDRVVVINLRRRIDRYRSFHDQLIKIDWPFRTPEVFTGIDADKLPMPSNWPEAKRGSWGCAQSHRAVLQQAILDDIDSLLVLEDDALFVDDFAARVETFLKAVPADWSSLMLGDKHRESPLAVSPGVLRCTRCAPGTQAYAVRGKYKAMLYQHWHSTQGHCDLRMADLHAKAKVYAPDPPLVYQSGSKSDITVSKPDEQLKPTEIAELFPDADPTLLGNRIAALTSALGFPPCGGCTARKNWLNKAHRWVRGETV